MLPTTVLLWLIANKKHFNNLASSVILAIDTAYRKVVRLFTSVAEACKEISTMSTRPASLILEESFLSIRAKVLEIAAALDRIDRAEERVEPLAPDKIARREKIDDAIQLLLTEGDDRAERIQLLFSREYSPSWRSEMKIE